MAEGQIEHGGGYWIYVRTWAWLLAITVVEVATVLLHVPRLLTIGGLLIMAILKAILIVSIFMHLRFERLNFIYTVVVPLVLIMVLFFGIVPDAVNMKRRAVPVPSLQEMESAVESTRPTAQPQAAAPATGVDAVEFKFTPPTLTVKAGAVRFRFHNAGAIPHSLRITDLGNAGIDPINPGASQEFTVTIPAGTHRFICDVPGHAEAGMVGRIVARP